MHKLTSTTGVLALALAAHLTTSAKAQEAPTELDRLLVTDGRTNVAQEKTGRAFTVIDGEQLARNQVRYVADALRLVPGFAVSRSGPAGGQTQVRVRGAEANHLLVMIDGVEVNEASGGEFDFGSLVVDNIDRIEVLRGPQSAFWGSNAMAGVVNIITKRGTRDGVSTSVRTEAGTDGTMLGGVTLSGGGEGYDIALAGVARRMDGFNISEFGSEKDGGDNVTLNGTFTVDLTPDLTIDGTLRHVNRRSKSDPQDYDFGSPTEGLLIDGDDEIVSRETFGSFGATHLSLDGALTQKARFTANDTFREYFTDGGLTSSNDGNRYNASYQATYAFETPGLLDALHQVTGGYEWERETFLPSHLTERLSRSSNSFIGEYRGEFLGQVFVNAAVRHDLNDRFADATTYSIAGAWAVPDSATRFHASVGTGVTNPTFFEQFGFVPDTFNGNPDLAPEESLGFDIGVEQGFLDGMLIVDVTYFNQDLTNEIATIYGGPPDFLSSPVNQTGRSKRQGVELAATVDFFNGFTLTGSYTYTDATEQLTSGDPRLVEVRRPRHAGSLGAAYGFDEDRARVFGEVVFNGEMEDVVFVPSLPSRVTLDSYAVVNVGGSYRFNETLETYARIENLFDDDYQELFGYNAQGITAFAGLKGTF